MFLKYKRLRFVLRALSSVLCGAAVFLGLFGIADLFSVLGSPLAEEGLAYIICGAAGIAVALVVFLIFSRSDMATARELNRKYGLNEKLETMLEYKNETSPMLELQREDAERSLKEVGRVRPPLTGLIASICIFALSIVVFLIPSFIKVPKPDTDTVPPVTAFKVTEIQLSALDELIENVQNSDMADPHRSDIVLTLEALREDIVSINTEDSKNERVLKDIDLILNYTDSSSYLLELIEAAWNIGTDTSKRLAEALNYYKWPKEDEQDRFTSALDKLMSELIHPEAVENSPNYDKITSETRNVLLALSGECGTALLKSEIPPSDPVYSILTRLATANEKREDGTRIVGLRIIASSENESYEWLLREAEATFTALSPELFASLDAHRESTETGEYAAVRLSEIFGVPSPKLKRPSLTEENGETSDTTNDNPGGGAMSSGTSYGSDDLVLDPYTGEYVKYGKLIERYYALLFDKLEGGIYTDEERDALLEYFDILYGGFKEKPNEE